MNSTSSRRKIKSYANISLKVFAAAGLTLITSVGNAYYTVLEEDPSPTRPSIVAPARPVAPIIDQFAIPFPKGVTPVTSSTRAVLDALFPKIKDDAQIRIVGRPDALYTSTGDDAMVPRKRAINIRDYLTRKGIPINNIVIEVDNTPNPQINGSTYPSYMYVTRPGNQAQQQSAQPSPTDYTPRRYQPAEMITESAPTPVRYAPIKQNRDAYQETAVFEPIEPPRRQLAPAQTSNTNRDKLMAYINAGVQSGVMSPTVALQLLQTLMETDTGNLTPMATSKQATQVQPRAEPQFTQLPQSSIAKQIWVLEKSMTLRENMDAWSKSAGWNPTTWDASNFYQINTTTVVKGDYPEVLRKIAESTNLNICVKTREKRIRVTDPEVACN